MGGRMKRKGTELLGPYLLRLARKCGDPEKAVEYAKKAVEQSSKKMGLEYILGLQALAEAYSRLGKFEDSVNTLNRCLNSGIGMEDVSARLLARSSVYMQLGEVYALMGWQRSSLDAYHSALDAQMDALDEMDPCVAETQRFLAEEHLKAMQFEQAEKLCKELLKTHESKLRSQPLEESNDRRLMALIYGSKGDHESALEQLLKASSIFSGEAEEYSLEQASIQACIADTLMALGRTGDAEAAYGNALSAFRRLKGEMHSAVASVYLGLSDLHKKCGHVAEAKSYCDRAAKIYESGIERHGRDALVSGLVETAAVYRSLGERGRASKLLEMAMTVVGMGSKGILGMGMGSKGVAVLISLELAN